MEEKSKPIPHYINNPIINAATAPELKLNRPTINYFKAIVFVIAHFLISELLIVIYTVISKNLDFSNLIEYQKYLLPLALMMFFISLKHTMIWFVTLYQRYAKSETRLRCHMTPSCSAYSILALKKYGAIIGFFKTIGRLKRCKFPGEIDYP